MKRSNELQKQNDRESQMQSCGGSRKQSSRGAVILFVVLCWMYYRKDVARKRPGVMFGIFLIALFGFRFFVEFIKNPQEEFERGMLLDMGQWLSVPFVILGVVILYRALKRPAKELSKKTK